MLKLFIKAFIVGASMMVPGVSGGSMAMILGEYDRLIDSVPGLFSREKRRASFLYLAVFCTAAVIGIVLAAKPLEMLISRYSVIVMYFFLGAVIGTIPMMFRKAKSQGFDVASVLFVLAGILLVLSIELVPEGLFVLSLEMNFLSLLAQFLIGAVVSVGLVLPGISTTYLLLVLGLYEPVLSAVSSGDFLSLVPVCIGGLAGILALTKLLQVAMQRYPKPSFMMILGFLLGSVREIYPGIPSGIGIPVALVLFVAGCIIVYKLSEFEERKEAREEAENNTEKEGYKE